MRKKRSDCKLLSLPPERQEQIAEWCRKPQERDEETGKPVARSGGLAFAQDQLAADGYKISLDALSRAFAFWQMQAQFRGNDAKAQDFEHLLRTEFPEATAEEITARGQLYFTMLASNAGDAEEFRAMEALRLAKQTAAKNAQIADAKLKQGAKKLKQKDADLALANRRVQLLEEKEAKAKETLGDGKLTPAEREARMKKIFGVQ